MENKPPGVISIWQNQTTGDMKISPQELRRKLEQLQKKTRRGLYRMSAGGAIMLVCFTVALVKVRNPWSRAGFALLIAWAIFVPLQAWRMQWPGSPAPGATIGACADFYRIQLQRLRKSLGSIGLWFLLPGLPGLLLVTLPVFMGFSFKPSLLLKALPFFSILALWLIMVLVMAKRERDRLQGEIEALDAFRGEFPE